MATSDKLVITDISILGKLSADELAQIVALQKEIIGDVDFEVQAEFMESLQLLSNGVFIIAKKGDTIVGMVQGTRIVNLRSSKVFVDSMVIHREYRKQGIGAILLASLELHAIDYWSDVTKIILTNGPRRGNGGFYRSLGYIPRADERRLVRWVKQLANIFSLPPNETYFWEKQIRSK